jgi:hypothetical protein
VWVVWEGAQRLASYHDFAPKAGYEVHIHMTGGPNVIRTRQGVARDRPARLVEAANLGPPFGHHLVSISIRSFGKCLS